MNSLNQDTSLRLAYYGGQGIFARLEAAEAAFADIQRTIGQLAAYAADGDELSNETIERVRSKANDVGSAFLTLHISSVPLPSEA